jgi:hypothetical protein
MSHHHQFQDLLQFLQESTDLWSFLIDLYLDLLSLMQLPKQLVVLPHLHRLLQMVDPPLRSNRLLNRPLLFRSNPFKLL